jgi:hypothetical protein
MERALFLFSLILFASASTALAIDTPLRDPQLLDRAVKEEVVGVGGVKVVLADYDLIQKDFPETRQFSHEQIDSWLCEHTGLLGKAQASQDKVNTLVKKSGKTAFAYRPHTYGRALVFEAGSGLIDAKGVGSTYPSMGDHGNGLATLGEAIREYLYEKLVKKVSAHSGLGMDTVGTYAVLDFGIDVKHPNGSTSPAGVVLRQSHRRFDGQYSLYDDDLAKEVEITFRRYGLTTAGAYRHNPTEQINVQGTKDRLGLIDFGGYLTVPQFEKPATNFYGRVPLLTPAIPLEFLQPDPALRIPLSIWGYTVSGKADPKLDNPWIWSHELADSWRKGTAGRADAEQHVKNLLGPVEEKLKLVPAAASCARVFSAVAPK